MMLTIFLILMCTTSLTLCGAMDMTVHNQYPDIELISPVYFCNHDTYNEYSVERADNDATMKISFSFDLDQLLSGILMCQVRKKGNIKSDYQPSTDVTSTEVAEDASKTMQLLVAWEIERSGESRVYTVLVEHDNELVWDEDKLAQFYDKVNEQFSRHYNVSESTWLVCDNTVLEATYEVVWKVGLELKITISKGVKNKYIKSALWIDSER
jgi:hypothetical protein